MRAADLVATVAQRCRRIPVTIWGFGVGGMLSGLVRVGTNLGRDDLVDHVAHLVGPTLTAEPQPTDHLISVETLLALRAARPELDVDAACERWVRAVWDAAQPVAPGPRVHRPDLPPWSSTIWVDCMHTDGPGLATLGYDDEALACVEEYAGVLQRADGLFHHGYDVETGRGNGVAWGRGQAWALLGLVDTLTEVDDAGLRTRLESLVEALARHEDAGRWRTIVDDPAAPIENSVAAYVALGVGRAAVAGLVDHGHAAMAERAASATRAALHDGGLDVSEATPVGDPQNYRRRATGVFPWGQGPVLNLLLDSISS